jgi:hypothetical protein
MGVRQLMLKLALIVENEWRLDANLALVLLGRCRRGL